LADGLPDGLVRYRGRLASGVKVSGSARGGDASNGGGAGGMTLRTYVVSGKIASEGTGVTSTCPLERTPDVTRSRRDVYIPSIHENQGNSAFLCLQIGATE
jgi:hypothetical protein